MSTPEPSLSLIGALAAALLPLGVTGLVLAAAREPALRDHLGRYLDALERELRYLQLVASPRRIAQAQAAAVVALGAAGLVAATPWPWALAVPVLIGPRWLLQHQRRRRTAAITAQIDSGLVAIANALKASTSLAEAIASACAVLPRPLCDELRVALREASLGIPLDRALENLAARVGSSVVTAALITLRIASSTGGDVIHTLETCARSLREMARLEGVVRTKTAEGRAQAAVIAVVPFPLFYLLDRLDPALLAPVWTTPAGHLALGIALALWAAAVALAREIMDVDI